MTACQHDSRAVCFLCSDQVSWWKEARLKAGYGEQPPNAPRYLPTEEDPAQRRQRFMWRKWAAATRARRKAGAV